MLVASFKVFDDFIFSTAPTQVSSVALARQLGQYDQLSLQAVVDQVNLAGTITVQIYHSADGLHFKPKNATAEISGSGSAPGQGGLTAGVTNTCTGGDTAQMPSLAFVQISVTLVTTTKAHVKIFVSARDSGASGPTGVISAPGALLPPKPKH